MDLGPFVVSDDSRGPFEGCAGRRVGHTMRPAMPDVTDRREVETRDDPSPLRSEPVERVKAMLDRWVSRTAEHLVLAMIKRGEPGVVVVPSDEYEGYMHTLEIMDDPEAQQALAEGEQDEREGRLRSYEDVRRDLGIA